MFPLCRFIFNVLQYLQLSALTGATEINSSKITPDKLAMHKNDIFKNLHMSTTRTMYIAYFGFTFALIINSCIKMTPILDHHAESTKNNCRSLLCPLKSKMNWYLINKEEANQLPPLAV